MVIKKNLCLFILFIFFVKPLTLLSSSNKQDPSVQELTPEQKKFLKNVTDGYSFNIKKLLTADPNLIHTTKEGMSALMIAISKKRHPLFLEFLMDNGCLIDFQSPKDGKTALHIASEMEDELAMALLLQRRANRWLSDHQGKHPNIEKFPYIEEILNKIKDLTDREEDPILRAWDLKECFYKAAQHNNSVIMLKILRKNIATKFYNNISREEKESLLLDLEKLNCEDMIQAFFRFQESRAYETLNCIRDINEDLAFCIKSKCSLVFNCLNDRYYDACDEELWELPEKRNYNEDLLIRACLEARSALFLEKMLRSIRVSFSDRDWQAFLWRHFEQALKIKDNACAEVLANRLSFLMENHLSQDFPQETSPCNEALPLASLWGGSELFQNLIEAKAQIDATHPETKKSALMNVAEAGNYPLVRMLLRAKANINLSCGEGTALDMAIRAEEARKHARNPKDEDSSQAGSSSPKIEGDKVVQFLKFYELQLKK